MKKYITYQISEDVIFVAETIKKDVPYWMQRKAVVMVKHRLKLCLECLDLNIWSPVLEDNISILVQCEKILTNN